MTLKAPPAYRLYKIYKSSSSYTIKDFVLQAMLKIKCEAHITEINETLIKFISNCDGLNSDIR